SSDVCSSDLSLPFSTLPLSRATLDNLDTLGYQAMTPVQAQALPQVLEGRDLIVQAKTGSGKTAAFGLGIVHRLDPALFAIQALVLCPTRELAEQVANELRRIARALGDIKVVTLRSEEHTSELQSREYLVCSRLRGKKKRG